MGDIQSIFEKEHTDVWDFIQSLEIKNDRENNDIYFKFIKNGIVSMNHIKLLDRHYLTKIQISSTSSHLILKKIILIAEGTEIPKSSKSKSIENIGVQIVNKFMDDSFGNIEEEKKQEGEEEVKLEEQTITRSSKESPETTKKELNQEQQQEKEQQQQQQKEEEEERKEENGNKKEEKTEEKQEEKKDANTNLENEMERRIEEIQSNLQEESKRLVKLMITSLNEKRVFFVLNNKGECYYDIGKENFSYYFCAQIDIQKDFVEKYNDQIKAFLKLENSYRNYSPITCAPTTQIKVNLLGKEKMVSVYSFDYDSWVQGRPYDFAKMYYILKNLRCKNEKQITKEVYDKNCL